MLSPFDTYIISYSPEYVNRFSESFWENVAQNEMVKTVRFVLSREYTTEETVLCRITEKCRKKMSLFRYPNSGII